MEPKRDCEGYSLCLMDLDWKPSHCENCGQYKLTKAKVEFERGLGNFVPLDQVSNEELLVAIKELMDEALRRKISASRS